MCIRSSAEINCGCDQAHSAYVTFYSSLSCTPLQPVVLAMLRTLTFLDLTLQSISGYYPTAPLAGEPKLSSTDVGGPLAPRAPAVRTAHYMDLGTPAAATGGP